MKKNDEEVVRGRTGRCELFIVAPGNGANVTFGFDPPISATTLSDYIRTNLVPKCPFRGRVLGFLDQRNSRRYSLEEVSADPIQFSGVVLQAILQSADLSLVEFFGKVEELRIRLVAERPLSPEILQSIISRCRIPWTWASNAIEGSTYTLGETTLAVLSGIAAPAGKPGEHFVNAIDHAAAIVALVPFVHSRGLSCDDIRTLHGIMLKHSLEHDLTPGAYRTVSIRVTGTTFQFPAFAEVPSLMDEFAAWLNSPIEPNAGAIIERAALAHLRFVSIHPFSDGNGRMARLILNLVLMQNGLLPIIIDPAIRPAYLAAIKEYQLHQRSERHDESFTRLVAELVSERLRIYLECGPEILPELSPQANEDEPAWLE